MATLPPLRILLVEDSPGDVRLVRELLRHAGSIDVDVQQVERLEQAVRLMATDGFHAIVLDLALPDSQGLETLGRVRAVTAAPVIVLTGSHDEELGVQALRDGAQDFLLKSRMYDGHLYRAIRFAIERHHLAGGLRAAESRLQAIQDAAPSGVITTDGSGVVQNWNAAAERLLGWRASEIVGRSLSDTAIAPRSRATWERALSRAVADQSGQRIHIVVSRRDQHEEPMEFVVTGVPAAGLVRIDAQPPDAPPDETLALLRKLTPRQRDILRLIAEGYSTRESARRLGISVKTAEAHRAHIIKRLGIRSVAGLVRYAARAGLIQLES